MNIITVIPLTKIPLPAPQTLTYFSSQQIEVGGIVSITIGRRKQLAVVLAAESVADKKQQIKKSPFRLKPIEEVVVRDSVVPRHYIALASWAAAYFYSSLGQVMRTFLPQIFVRPTKKVLQELPQFATALKLLPESKAKRVSVCPILYWARHDDEKKIIFYTRKIRKVLASGQSVLFLVSELYKIEYFQKKIPELRSAKIVRGNLTPAAQYKIWNDARIGKIRCIIGTRSALAIPLQNLGLIILDEEESSFYKSFDQQPYLNGKTVALKLADLVGANVILGSDLPSIESFWMTRKRKYELKTISYAEAPTSVTIVDMREELKEGNFSIFSRALQAQLLEVIKSKKQAILFINRKGLSTGLLCRDCGHIIVCVNCDVPLVLHKTPYAMPHTTYMLICHHCGTMQKPSSICPKCASYRIKFMGTGTQRVEQELQKFFVKNNIDKSHFAFARLDTETAPTWGRQKEIFEEFKGGKFTFLIGTQLMLKTALLPKVHLSCAITIDPLFSLPDFRIYEQALHIIDNLRAHTTTKFILQTYIADNAFMQNIRSNQWDKLFTEELENRRALSLPPFSQLIKLAYVHPDSQKAEQEAQILKNKLGIVIRNLKFEIRNFEILGPAPAFIPRENNRYIWQIVIKSKIDDLAVRNAILRVVPSSWKIDVDPVLLL